MVSIKQPFKAMASAIKRVKKAKKNRPESIERPPKLGSEVPVGTANGTEWKSSDEVWIKGRVYKGVPKKELRRILFNTKGGGIYLLGQMKPNQFIRLAKFRGINHMRKEHGLKRTAKEFLKSLLRDPHSRSWPYAHNGYWTTRHDGEHLEVATLKAIPVKFTRGKHAGKRVLVNGVDGISARIVRHFHPNDPLFTANYNGTIGDEYRVAVHTALKHPNFVNTLRVRYYMRHYRMDVSNPFEIWIKHKETMDRAGIEAPSSIYTRTSMFRARRLQRQVEQAGT